MFTSFPRCACRTRDGRQCWRKPDHTGSHLVIPQGKLDELSINRVIGKIRKSRPDLTTPQLMGALFDGLMGR